MFWQVGMVVFFSLASPVLLCAQPCNKTFLNHCCPTKSNFNYTPHEASTAFKLTLGGEARFTFTLKKGMDYRIFICADAVFDDIIKLVLKNTEGVELYNNARHNYQLNVEFSNGVTRQVVFEISSPEPESISNDNNTEGCIGLYIEQVETPKTGF
jgi:hypothetical protein